MKTPLVALLLLVGPGTASAECAWVLWSRMVEGPRQSDWTSGGSAFPTYGACRETIRKYTGLTEEGSFTDWLQWVLRRGPYDRRRPLPGSDDFVGAIWVEGGAMVQVKPHRYTEWKCLPDTIDPRGPKGGAR